VDIYLPASAPPLMKASPRLAAAKKSVKVSPALLDQYAGDYRLGPSQVLTISRTADQLYLSVPGQRFLLTALSETEFLFDLAQARIAFQKDKAGKAQQFVWKQGGAEQVAPRVVLVRPTPQELQEFAGAYSNEEVDFRLGLEVRGDVLVIVHPREGEIRLNPDEKDQFVSNTRVCPKIEFQRDPQGRVSGFIIASDPVRDLVFQKR
jgi:hypothetical protein